MGNFGIKISKDGVNVNTATSDQLSESSQFDTLKIQKTGTLTLNVAEETLNGESSEHHSTYAHGLGYMPFFLPQVTGAGKVLYSLSTASNTSTGTTLVANDAIFTVDHEFAEIENITDGTVNTILTYTNSTTVTVSDSIGDTWDGDMIRVLDFTDPSPSTVYINDLTEIKIPAGGYSPGTSGEIYATYIDATNLYLQCYRYESLGINETFIAKTITVDYTIFHNQFNTTLTL